MAMRDEFDLAAEETPQTDDEILDMIETLYNEDERVDPTYIEVTIEGGVVRLEGMVASSQELEMAESLLDNIEGIIGVQNDLEVVESGFSPDELGIGTEEGIQEEEFEGVEVLPEDEKLTSEDPMEVVEEGKMYVPPTAPIFPEERTHAAERMRERVAEEEATGETQEQL